MKSNPLIRIIATAAALAMFLFAAGCGAKPSASPAPTATPPPRPDVTAAPGKIAAPLSAGYDGFALKIKPVQGQELIIKDSATVQQVMDAFGTQRLQVENAQAKFGNKLTVLDAAGKARYTFTVASDGQLLMKYQDGRVFQMPGYVYYLLENSLWTYSGSLMESDVKWQTDKGTSQLELELPRLIKAAMLPAFGYSPAYFVTYKIYGVNTATRNTAKVYLLVTYAGYDIKGESFTPEFFYTSPMTMIFTTTGGNLWKLTALKQPVLTAPQTEESTTQPAGSSSEPEGTPKPRGPLKGQALYDSIRLIFPFDYMEAVTDDMGAKNKNTTVADMQKDIVRQATEYLNAQGIAGLTVES